MELNITFRNPQQREFYYSVARNQCFSGGFNNGKSFAGCLKAITLLTTFPNYKYIIARQVFSDLKKTTMETFFKVLPGGKDGQLVARHNEQDGFTILTNGSRVDWLHLDKVDESTLRGFEINSVLVDQAEEIQEKVYDVLDARVGRWDGAEIPKALLDANPDWPLSPTGKRIAPSYMGLLCNPDTQYHFIYRKYHPDSLERDSSYFYVEGEWDSSLGSAETYQNALKRGEEWVNKYVRGQWGVSNAQIHRLDSLSLLDYSDDLLERILRKGNLFRVLDHGDSSPTCCLWVAVLDGCYFFYREYYVPNRVISEHRQAINDLSGNEQYSNNYADPSIFKKSSQKDGGFWTVADEYSSSDVVNSPPLYWCPADNNEFATRNRINECTRLSDTIRHPITGKFNAPRVYFIKRSTEYPYGCFHAINELQSQRRKLLDYIDGRAVYCDDREDSVTDHAYDCIRYFHAMHGSGRPAEKREPPRNSFKWFQMMRNRKKAFEASAPLSA